MQSRELVKLYYRIGEVSEIVGVQPHVLRYWETEFRSIRPQKSSKGQRVYSRRDVEKLLRVKDLLRNQGFTIAGARKRLSDPAEVPPATPAPPSSPSGAVSPPSGGVSLSVVPSSVMPPSAAPVPVAPLAAVSAGSVSSASLVPGASGSAVPAAAAGSATVVSLVDSAALAPIAAAEESPIGRTVAASAQDHRAKNMRKALLGLRQDLLQMLAEINATRTQQPRGH